MMYLQKVISQKIFEKKVFFVDVLKVTDKRLEQDPDPDPLVRGADPDPYQNVIAPTGVSLFCPYGDFIDIVNIVNGST